MRYKIISKGGIRNDRTTIAHSFEIGEIVTRWKVFNDYTNNQYINSTGLVQYVDCLDISPISINPNIHIL